jgi:ABC-type sugar transport system ATPase subunit
MTGLSLEHLTLRRGGLALLDGLSLAVPAGSLSVILGPAGAGKTRLARVLAGLEIPDSGRILLDGEVFNPRTALADRRIRVVLHELDLWPHLSVADQIALPLGQRRIGRKEARKRVEEALATVRAEGLAERRLTDLTPPQRRRVAIARACAQDPQILVLDEPLAGLDPPARIDLRDDLRHIQAESRATLLLLTREPRDALILADQLAIIDLGRIVQSGPPQEVYQNPRDVLVAQIFGPANLIQGQAESLDARGGVILRTPLGRLIGRAAGPPPAPGENVTLAIRPESLLLGANLPPDANRLSATLERADFLGALRQLHLRGPGDWPLVALSLPSLTNHLQPGQSLTLGIPPDHVVILARR